MGSAMSLDLSTIEHAAQGSDEHRPGDRPPGRRAGWCLVAVGAALMLAGASAVAMLVLPSALRHAGSLTGQRGDGSAVVRTGATATHGDRRQGPSTTPPGLPLPGLAGLMPGRRAARPAPAPDAQNSTAASTMPPPGSVPPGVPAHRGPIPAFPTSAPGVTIKPSSSATASSAGNAAVPSASTTLPTKPSPPTLPATSPAPSATPGS